MSADTIRCEEVIEHLFEYLDRELEHVKSTEIERHLEHCRECFSRAEFEKRLRERVRATGEAVAPPRLRQRVQRLIARF
jgi:anti-sigma factor (TIGR02949 family)